MKKRILSILLCLCMVLAIFPVAAFAEEGKTVSFTVTADKTEAQPGDTITFTLTMGPVKGLYYADLNLRIPEGLTYVAGSGSITEGLKDKLKAGQIQFLESHGNILGLHGCDYTSDANTVLMTFQCTVNDDAATGAKTVGVGLYDDDKTNCFDVDMDLIAASFNSATVTVSEALAPALAITINGPDVVCAESNYFFTATASEGVTFDELFGLGYGIDEYCFLTLGQEADGTAWGVVQTYYYSAGSFELTVSGETADGTPVSATKTVQVSPEHIYENGVCGCGAVLTYTVEYIGSGDDPICMDIKTYGQDLTLRGETFTMDGYVQTGWVDKETGAVYHLGDTYTENADVTLNPVFEKLITLTVPYTTTVALGDAGVPGEKTFTLALIGDSAPDKDKSNVTVSGSVTTDGAGDYDGTLTITGPEETLWYMLSEGAFVQQVDNGEAGWTVDDTVWGVLMEEIPVAYATSDDAAASEYTVYVVPASIDGNGDYYIDWENLQTADMTFTNTYTAHAYALNHDADGHWDECSGCGDIQNEEPHQYGDWTVTKEATEKEAGEKEHTCTVCGYTETAEIAKLAAKPNTDTKSGTTAPATGDNSHMALWIALLFMGGAGVIGTTVYGKKKRAK